MKFLRTKEQRKKYLKEISLKYLGYGFFALFFAVICFFIFKFLPSDAPINSEISFFKNKNEQSDLEQEFTQKYFIDPASYHNKAIEHRKKDTGLQFYRNEISKQSVIWFYNQITNNQDVTLAILQEADKNEIPLSLAFALAWTESSYKITAVNGNTNLSIDRGLFQLNNKSFPYLSEKDFFDPYVSAKYGLAHLRFCIETAGNEVTALAMYNAGTTKVRNNKTPQITLNYVSKIINYRDGLNVLFNSQVAMFYRENSDYYLAFATK
ncbi:MAG: transglycosylase SLT domain-containing protein [Treponemataceae bacterium]